MMSIIGQTPKAYGESNIVQSRVGEELLSVLDFSRDYPLVLDVGSGTGNVTRNLSGSIPGVKEVWGVDIDGAMVAYAATTSNKENEQGDGIKFNLRQLDISNPSALDLTSEIKKLVGKFDLVISNFVLHWINPERRGAAFENITKLLKRDGVFASIIFCPRPILQSMEPSEAQQIVEHMEDLKGSRENWAKFAEKYGLKVLKNILSKNKIVFKSEDKDKIKKLVDLGLTFYLKNLGFDRGNKNWEKIKKVVENAAKLSHLVESGGDVIFSQETVLIHCCK